MEHGASGHRPPGSEPGVRAARARHAERRTGERERTYLSIREVLELLVTEFPDVTISKIRFLESKGLIEPERTPSGYRRFSGPDVERLRWILLQQREHFLPLKVIKGRLDTAAGLPQGAAIEASLFDDELREPPVLGGRLVGVASHPSAEGAGLRLMPEPAPSAGSRQVLALLGDDAPAGGVGTPDPGTSGAPGSAPAALGGEDGPEVPAPPRSPGEPVSRPRDGQPADQPGPRRREAAGTKSRMPARRAVAGSRGGGGHGAGAGAEVPGGASLSAVELAAAAGVDPSLVAELEDYRLVRCTMVGGERCYDEEALAVTRLAGAFRAYGVEARHLTTFRHAAEREVGLFSQVVTPLLRQRNPTAREQARAGLAELARLGAELQAVLVRAELRGIAGG